MTPEVVFSENPSGLLLIERAVAGGRMLARHEGRVVLVAGAIPGERVRVQVERVTRQVTWAHAVEVIDPSPDRREPACDPSCGGSLYAHIRYERQLLLKGEVIADAFRRIGKITLDSPIAVSGSPERGYRLRAHLHVRDGRAGFLREGTHAMCDAAATGQLRPEAVQATEDVLRALDRRAAECAGVVVAENIAGTERVLHLEARDGGALDDGGALRGGASGATGITTGAPGRVATLFGSATVTDAADQLFGGDLPTSALAVWTRHASSFFQGNRFLIGALVRRVLALTTGERVVDLYAGVGLFAIALASRGGPDGAARTRVVAVEGERSSGDDLVANAGAWRDRIRVLKSSVEDIVARPLADRPDTVILNPPRAGVSSDALRGLMAWRAPRLVYVSCDPPTLARDAARMAESGYRLLSLDAFDLFPNTPHVETVAVFERR